jgi:hypothetical protein
LRVSATGTNALMQYTVRWTRREASGELYVGVLVLGLVTAMVAKTDFIPLNGGELVSVEVEGPSTGEDRGSLGITVRVVGGLTSVAPIIRTLIQGWPGTASPLRWDDGTATEYIRLLPGDISIVGPTPAAGSNATLDLSGFIVEELHLVISSIVTNALGVARTPTLRVLSGSAGNAYYRAIPQLPILTTQTMQWGPDGAPQNPLTGWSYGFFGKPSSVAGLLLFTVISGIDPGDQVQEIAAVFRGGVRPPT